MFIYHCPIVVRIEIELEIDSADMEISAVGVKGVYVKIEFWPSFQTSYVFLAIAAESNSVFDIMLYYVVDVLDILSIGSEIGNLVIEIY